MRSLRDPRCKVQDRQDNRLIDYGTAPTVFVTGVAHVQIIDGLTKFALFERKTRVFGDLVEHFDEVTQNVVLPTDAVRPAMHLMCKTFGPRLLRPALTYDVRRVWLS
jgi:hypothetical protein